MERTACCVPVMGCCPLPCTASVVLFPYMTKERVVRYGDLLECVCVCYGVNSERLYFRKRLFTTCRWVTRLGDFLAGVRVCYMVMVEICCSIRLIPTRNMYVSRCKLLGFFSRLLRRETGDVYCYASHIQRYRILFLK